MISVSLLCCTQLIHCSVGLINPSRRSHRAALWPVATEVTMVVFTGHDVSLVYKASPSQGGSLVPAFGRQYCKDLLSSCLWYHKGLPATGLLVVLHSIAWVTSQAISGMYILNSQEMDFWMQSTCVKLLCSMKFHGNFVSVPKVSEISTYSAALNPCGCWSLPT